MCSSIASAFSDSVISLVILALCGLRSHLTPPWIVVAAQSACLPASYTEIRPCDTESRSASMQKWA